MITRDEALSKVSDWVALKGYSIIGSLDKFEIGEIIPSSLIADGKLGMLTQPFKVIGETTLTEFMEQHQFIYGFAQPFSRFKYFYKVITD